MWTQRGEPWGSSSSSAKRQASTATATSASASVVPSPRLERRAVSADGALEWVSRFAPWGEAPEQDSAFAARFPGQWYNAESGLHYNLFRYYDPDLGRYISPDPLDILAGFNDYRYVPDPYGMSDPLGRVENRVTTYSPC
ncbi:RHS repeat-associated core domain-containing protein [Corallococcus sp. AB038B]|nr:RHS repeat-associated core domain-containing protein [Corallococcus sp. AB038B]